VVWTDIPNSNRVGFFHRKKFGAGKTIDGGWCLLCSSLLSLYSLLVMYRPVILKAENFDMYSVSFKSFHWRGPPHSTEIFCNSFLVGFAHGLLFDKLWTFRNYRA
jgi:hypothetical protein